MQLKNKQIHNPNMHKTGTKDDKILDDCKKIPSRAMQWTKKPKLKIQHQQYVLEGNETKHSHWSTTATKPSITHQHEKW